MFCESRLLGDNITDIIRVRKAGGNYITLMSRASAIERNGNGRAIIVPGAISAMDTTRTSHSLGKDDKLFHALNSMGSGQWNWDPNGNFIHLCGRFLAVLGYEPADAEKIGKFWRDLVHPDDLGKVDAARDLAVASPDHGDTSGRMATGPGFLTAPA